MTVESDVRQGDIISPKFLEITLEDVFKILKYDNLGIVVCCSSFASTSP